MSPQPAATEKAETSAERQIARAKHLEKTRAEVMKHIGANREYLRLMAVNGELTEDQEDWLEAFYPSKEKGERRTAEEIERTRAIKQEARK
jgi:hypothetical protein